LIQKVPYCPDEEPELFWAIRAGGSILPLMHRIALAQRYIKPHMGR
jgi:hypothetical protein